MAIFPSVNLRITFLWNGVHCEENRLYSVFSHRFGLFFKNPWTNLGEIWICWSPQIGAIRGYVMVGIPCVERGVQTFGKSVCSLPGDNWFIP